MKKSDIKMENINIIPEILDNSGFIPIYADKSAYKWTDKPDEDNYNYYNKIIVIDLSSPRASYIKNELTHQSYEGEIKYVHQLQQLLYICNITKEIKTV